MSSFGLAVIDLPANFTAPVNGELPVGDDLHDLGTAPLRLRLDAVRQRIVDSIPLKRLIEPAEIARLALYLASDVSRGMTGQAVVIDAGFLVR